MTKIEDFNLENIEKNMRKEIGTYCILEKCDIASYVENDGEYKGEIFAAFSTEFGEYNTIICYNVDKYKRYQVSFKDEKGKGDLAFEKYKELFLKKVLNEIKENKNLKKEMKRNKFEGITSLFKRRK